MAEQKKITRQNSVHIVGFLQENTLEKVSIQDKGEVVRGNLIIATDETSRYKVSFYVPQYLKNGDESADFTSLLELLPEKTTSIAKYLKTNPGTTYEMATEAASKLWVVARFEEFASAEGERSRSMITLKGFKAGFKQETEDTPFTPHAEFTVDAYIESIKNEVKYADENDEEGTETGRLIVTGLLPVFDESVYKIEFIAPVENGIAEFMSHTYSKGVTATLKGNLVNIDKKVLKEDSESEEEFFGVPAGPQYKTVFIRERIITGLSKRPILQGEEKSISLEFVKKGLAKRLVKAQENGKREAKGKGTNNTSTAPKAEEKQEFVGKASNMADMDF